MSPAGDVNGDRIDDVIVAAPYADAPGRKDAAGPGDHGVPVCRARGPDDGRPG